MIKRSVYLLIPVHNRQATTLACLERLYSIGAHHHYHILVVDDGSIDGTSEMTKARYPDVTIVAGDGNLWWTGAIAEGMRHAHNKGATHYIWLNDDCLVPPKTIANLIQFVDDHPNSIIGAQGYTDETQKQLAFGGKKLRGGYYEMFRCPSGETAPCDMLSGNLVCIPRSVVDSIGFPDTKLPHYGGDTLYLIQARKAGFQIFVDGLTNPIDIPGQSALQPTSWMLQSGGPLRIIKLIFQPQSILSWRVWWILLTTEHGPKGVIFFIAKYLSILPKLIIITGFRFLSPEIRQRVMVAKQNLARVLYSTSK